MRSHCRALGKDTRLSKLHCGRGYNLHCHKFHGEDVDQELWQRLLLWKCLLEKKRRRNGTLMTFNWSLLLHSFAIVELHLFWVHPKMPLIIFIDGYLGQIPIPFFVLGFQDYSDPNLKSPFPGWNFDQSEDISDCSILAKTAILDFQKCSNVGFLQLYAVIIWSSLYFVLFIDAAKMCLTV